MAPRPSADTFVAKLASEPTSAPPDPDLELVEADGSTLAVIRVPGEGGATGARDNWQRLNAEDRFEWVAPALVDDGQQRSGWFTQFPYQVDDGIMTFSRPSPGDAEPWQPALWSMRVESDFGTNFANQQLIGGHVLWEHRNRFGIETRFDKLQDDFGGRTDSLWFGDVNGTSAAKRAAITC